MELGAKCFAFSSCQTCLLTGIGVHPWSCFKSAREFLGGFLQFLLRSAHGIVVAVSHVGDGGHAGSEFRRPASFRRPPAPVSLGYRWGVHAGVRAEFEQVLGGGDGESRDTGGDGAEE